MFGAIPVPFPNDPPQFHFGDAGKSKNKFENSRPVVGFRWGNGNTITCFQTKSFDQVKAEEDTFSKPINSQPVNKQLKVYSSEELVDNRRLFIESHATFLSLQFAMSKQKTQSEKYQLLRLASRNYRAIIVTQKEELEAIIQSPNIHIRGEPKDIESYKNQVNFWAAVSQIWYLIEVFLLPPKNYIIFSFSEWVRSTFPDPSSDNKWTILFTYLIRGDFKKASKIIRILSKENQNYSIYFQKIDQLIQQFPSISSKDQKTSEFQESWVTWHNQSKTLSRQIAGIDENFKTIFAILLGDLETIKRATENIHWLECFAADILFKHPTTTNQSARELLLNHFNALAEHNQDDSEMKRNLMYNIITGDIVEVISILSSTASLWTTVHITDLFYHANLLNSQHSENFSSIREKLIVEYASDLMRDARHWQLASNYLSHCGEIGPFVLSYLIERIPIQSDVKAFKLIQLCKLHNLQKQEKIIYTVLASKALQHHRFEACLEWLSRIPDHNRINKAISKIIQYSDTSKTILSLFDSWNSNFSAFVFDDHISSLLSNFKLLSDFKNVRCFYFFISFVFFSS